MRAGQVPAAAVSNEGEEYLRRTSIRFSEAKKLVLLMPLLGQQRDKVNIICVLIFKMYKELHIREPLGHILLVRF